jgi:chromosome segregation protein
MTVLLKQLDIHGFKSFATPTPFVFDRGMTAIIGPNGSGKSNVAEALRWVLGEQGYSNLRSRKTEDVIFAGSDKRAQLAMAEVVLTLDNADGDLPLPFSEITITRRAFRSGENQYLINGSRVRLKDVHQLVAPLGQSYTIIGQGLVDAALSQRPEERRGLFEHAAGISGLRLRANEAEKDLAEASANAQRMRDILSELEPRVRSLERQAKMAREYGDVRDRLIGLQRRYYAALWSESEAKVGGARESLRTTDTAYQAIEREHTEASQRVSRLRGEERQLTEELATLADAVAAHDRALAAARHRRELLESESRAGAQRLTDLRSIRDDLTRERDAAAADIQRLTAEATQIASALEKVQQQLAARDAELAEARSRRSQIQQEIATADRRAVDLTRVIAGTEGNLSGLAERYTAIDAEAQQVESAIASDAERRAALEAQRAEIEQRLTDLRSSLAAVEREQREHDAEIVRAREQAAACQQDIDRQERELASLQARHDLLERTHASGEGLYAGVRAVLRAVHKGDLVLPGLVGTVAETVEVPTEYETAIEVALGGHLQDIIVRTWADAQTAIDYLKRAHAGRATFQPLDSLRPSRRSSPAARDPDLVGIAADLVRYPEEVAPVVEQTLGRTLIVRDLDASRRLLKSSPGWTLVTLSGEITRPSGAVTGGGRTPEAGLLARERERRSLPKQIAARQDALQSVRASLEQETAGVAAMVTNAAATRARQDALRLDVRAAQADLERAIREQQAAGATVTNLHDRQSRVAARRTEIDAAVAEARARLQQAQADLESVRSRREALATQLDALPEIADESIAGLRTEMAALRERQRSISMTAQRAGERVANAEKNIAARTAEIDRVIAVSSGEGTERATLDAEITRLERLLRESQSALPPRQQERADVTAALARSEKDLDRASERIREAERARDTASLGLARAQDEQVFLAERIRNDLDITDPSTLDEGDDEPAPDEQEINRLRERLRRMSVVGEDVLEQHEAESERLAYLQQQLDDVDQAAAGLRQVLSELHGRMATQFNETFREVATAFETTFTRLFGGGTARLVLGSSEDGTTGIDIVAQPPGKRLQNLTALSGGERSLTAVALLIAIQRVNPSPFCLLDEVDAALDEANVVRFRDEIRELSNTTQFVVITHNRGTIEGSDTLYGVTMSGDGVSRVLSLRLEEAIKAVEEYAVTGNG